MEEFFDILDENGNKMGKTKARTEVHRDGDWYKAVHISKVLVFIIKLVRLTSKA